MRRRVLENVVILVTLGWSALVLAADRPHSKALSGRQVKVAAIPIGFGGDHGRKLRLAIEHLETAGANAVDITCLPEEFAGTAAEPIPGPTTQAIGELARKHHMVVVLAWGLFRAGRQLENLPKE